MSGFDLLRYGRKSLTALAFALPLAVIPSIISTPAQAQTAMCIPSVDRATPRGLSVNDVIDVTVAQNQNLSDAEIGALVRDIAGSRTCGMRTTGPQPVGYQRTPLQPRLAY